MPSTFSSLPSSSSPSRLAQNSMSPAPKSASKSARHPELMQRPRPRVHSAMACDTAFRVVARSCLWDLTANQEAAYRGDPEALHRMRIALTRLRTAISFFSPMVADPQRTRIGNELKWLHAHLGAVRDWDVAIERLKEVNKRAKATPGYQAWKERRADGHRRLARALRSIRYRRLVKSSHDWIENRTLVHEKRKEGHADARFLSGGVWRSQTGAMAEKSPEEEPQTPGYECEEKTSAAAAEQEAMLFDRIPDGPVFGKTIFKAAGCVEVST